ncbi:MAG: hypothetical protein PHQ86_01350 [Dehalococcoidales bacterium]|nr:hypothetical protein [Dehalococcoidales bacterium]
MLGVTIWFDGQTVEVTGTIEPELQVSRCTHHPDVRPVAQILLNSVISSYF